MSQRAQTSLSAGTDGAAFCAQRPKPVRPLTVNLNGKVIAAFLPRPWAYSTDWSARITRASEPKVYKFRTDPFLI
jgi:hypothetical protein